MYSGFFDIPKNNKKNSKKKKSPKNSKILNSSESNLISSLIKKNGFKINQMSSQKNFKKETEGYMMKKNKSHKQGLNSKRFLTDELRKRLKLIMNKERSIFTKKIQIGKIKHSKKSKKTSKSPMKNRIKKLLTNEKLKKNNYTTKNKFFKNISLEQISKKSHTNIRYKKKYQFKTQKTPNKKSSSIKLPYDQKKKQNSKSPKPNQFKIFFRSVKKNNKKYLKNFYQIFYNFPKEKRNKFKFTLMDKEGCRVTHFAVWHNNPQLIGFLLSNQVDFNKVNKDGITPLMLAALKGHKKLVALLAKICEDINFCDVSGNSVLHYAIVKENLGIVRLLLENDNLDIFLRNKDGKNCLDLAHPRICIELKNLFNEFEKEKLIGKKDVEIYKENNASNKKIKTMRNKSNKKTVHIFPSENNLSKLENKTEKINLKSFIIHSCIGKGSFGEVFFVEKKDSNNYYAMKVLEKEKVFKDNLKKYVLTERNVLSVINHPFIVKLRYAFQNKNYLFLIMDYYPGGDLGDYLEIENNFSERRSRIYISELILALEELHNNNIIFRDLKPENIVLDNQGHALLIDFGLSKSNVRSYFKGAKSFCGSVAYLAPEMIKKKGHGKAMDWYLLGVLLYEMLIGIPPFYDDSKEKLFSNIENQKLEIPGFFSQNVRDLLFKLLEKDPVKRLGVQGIKSHAWFGTIKWDDVLKRKLKPPKPMMKKLKLFGVKKNLKFSKDEGRKFSSVNGWTFIEDVTD